MHTASHKQMPLLLASRGLASIWPFVRCAKEWLAQVYSIAKLNPSSQDLTHFLICWRYSNWRWVDRHASRGSRFWTKRNKGADAEAYLRGDASPALQALSITHHRKFVATTRFIICALQCQGVEIKWYNESSMVLSILLMRCSERDKSGHCKKE